MAFEVGEPIIPPTNPASPFMDHMDRCLPPKCSLHPCLFKFTPSPFPFPPLPLLQLVVEDGGVAAATRADAQPAGCVREENHTSVGQVGKVKMVALDNQARVHTSHL